MFGYVSFFEHGQGNGDRQVQGVVPVVLLISMTLISKDIGRNTWYWGYSEEVGISGKGDVYSRRGREYWQGCCCHSWWCWWAWDQTRTKKNLFKNFTRPIRERYWRKQNIGSHDSSDDSVMVPTGEFFSSAFASLIRVWNSVFFYSSSVPSTIL